VALPAQVALVALVALLLCLFPIPLALVALLGLVAQARLLLLVAQVGLSALEFQFRHRLLPLALVSACPMKLQLRQDSLIRPQVQDC
jgi:hypothetical protein